MTDDSQVSFPDFVMSLASTAYVHLGEIADPASGEKAVNLQAARHMIDILSMLQGKTQGNLLAEESELVESVLYDLRMRFVEASRLEKRIIVP